MVEDMLQSLQDLGVPASEVEPQVFGDDDGSGVPMSQLMVRAQTTVTEGSRVVFDIQFHGPLRSDIKTVHWQISTNLLPRTYRRIGGLSPVGATGGLSPVGATATQSSVPSSAAGSGGAERASPTSTPTRQRSASPQPDPATAGEDPEEPAEKDNEIVVHVATEMLDLAALAQQNAARTGGPQESDPEVYLSDVNHWGLGDLPFVLRLLSMQSEVVDKSVEPQLVHDRGGWRCAHCPVRLQLPPDLATFGMPAPEPCRHVAIPGQGDMVHCRLQCPR